MAKTKNCLLTAAAVSAALVAQSAAAFEFHGYFRSGAGVNSEGGDWVVFQLPGAGSKYRLGNESQNYGELIFQQDLYKGDDGSYFTYYNR
ncbi:MAG: carbohydrate porin, partial [Ectothiorhodospiraceae bacterium]